MTCPFYVCDGRPECILGDDRAERHCGPRQYPVGPCTLDAIGRGEAWRSFVGQIRNFDNGYAYVAGPAWWSDEVWFMPGKTICASGWTP